VEGNEKIGLVYQKKGLDNLLGELKAQFKYFGSGDEAAGQVKGKFQGNQKIEQYKFNFVEDF
jgi:hypothetical protein